MNSQIQSLINSSEKVIKDCSLKNGAIVAANSSKAYFPKEAKYYRFVWPRDAMYTGIAAKILGIKIQEKFFKWCMKAEDWNKTGLFYEKYFINGKKALYHFQPDQTGSVLIALFDYYKDNKKDCRKFEKLIKKSANGLCKIWYKDHFNLVTQDLWEERLSFPDLKENFTYSLAACYKGLLCANELIPNKKWVKTANEMKRVLLRNKRFFFRSFGNLNDERADASLLGLVWPFKLVKANDKKMARTVKTIEEKIVKNFGVHRYENDEYDGWMYNKERQEQSIEVLQKGIHRKKGAGYWPLLNFWMTIYYLEKKDRTKALKYYKKVLNDLKRRKFIPEQIFDNKIQVSVSPLCWSHSMFLIASKKLQYL